MKSRRTPDATLRHLTYDAAVGAYVAETTYNSHVVRLHLDCNDESQLDRARARGRVVLRDLDALARGAANYAVEKLLDLHNDVWRDEDEPETTADDFKLRMTLSSIDIGEDGSLTFYHHDGDLFWGHCIEIGRNAKGEFCHADIPG